MQQGWADYSIQQIGYTSTSSLHLADWHQCRISHCNIHPRSRGKKNTEQYIDVGFLFVAEVCVCVRSGHTIEKINHSSSNKQISNSKI